MDVCCYFLTNLSQAIHQFTSVYQFISFTTQCSPVHGILGECKMVIFQKIAAHCARINFPVLQGREKYGVSRGVGVEGLMKKINDENN